MSVGAASWWRCCCCSDAGNDEGSPTEQSRKEFGQVFCLLGGEPISSSEALDLLRSRFANAPQELVRCGSLLGNAFGNAKDEAELRTVLNVRSAWLAAMAYNKNFQVGDDPPQFLERVAQEPALLVLDRTILDIEVVCLVDGRQPQPGEMEALRDVLARLPHAGEGKAADVVAAFQARLAALGVDTG